MKFQLYVWINLRLFFPNFHIKFDFLEGYARKITKILTLLFSFRVKPKLFYVKGLRIYQYLSLFWFPETGEWSLSHHVVHPCSRKKQRWEQSASEGCQHNRSGELEIYITLLSGILNCFIPCMELGGSEFFFLYSINIHTFSLCFNLIVLNFECWSHQYLQSYPIKVPKSLQMLFCPYNSHPEFLCIYSVTSG